MKKPLPMAGKRGAASSALLIAHVVHDVDDMDAAGAQGFHGGLDGGEILLGHLVRLGLANQLV